MLELLELLQLPGGVGLAGSERHLQVRRHRQQPLPASDVLENGKNGYVAAVELRVQHLVREFGVGDVGEGRRVPVQAHRVLLAAVVPAAVAALPHQLVA